MRAAAVSAALLLIPAALPASAYEIGAESIGAGGILYSTAAMEDSVEVGAAISDASGNLIDGHAAADGVAGGMNGYMLAHIVNYLSAQNTNVTNFLIEKSWKSVVTEEIHDFTLDPGASELVLRLQLSATDESDLAIAPSPGFDNGYARSHVWARLRYYNAHPHVGGLDEVLGDGRSDRDVPDEWVQVFGGDTSPPGYGSASAGSGSATVELRIPASEVDADDHLLVSGQLYGEVRGGHWNGAFAKSQLSSGSLSLQVVGGDGAALNPDFLTVPEPDPTLLGEAALAALFFTRRRRG